jgi:hypothetical protein
MKIPNRLAWWIIRASMEITVVRLCLRGMSWTEARYRVAETTKLYMHRHICKQWGEGGGDGG